MARVPLGFLGGVAPLDPLADPLADLDEARLERLARVAGYLLAGRPLHHGGRLPHPRSTPAGLEFLEHRELMPGDDPRHLDWRASARSRTPLVRRYRDERAGEWLILLDRSASMGAAPGAWPLALQLAGAFAYLLLRLGHRVGLGIFSTDVDAVQPPGRGRAAYLALRRALADARPREGGGGSRLAACLGLLGRGTQAAVISDFLTPDAMGQALSQLRGRCEAVHCLQVLGEPWVPAVAGSLRLTDAETGEGLDAQPDPGLAGRVAECQASLAAGLERHCRRRGMRYSGCRVGSAWDRVLLEHLVGPEARLA